MDVTLRDDPESADAAPLDLTPRVTAPRSASPKRVQRIATALIALALVGAVVAVARALFDSTTYFYNVDQAVKMRPEIGDRRVRLQGNVIKGSVVERGNRPTAFTISYNSVAVHVQHAGDVPDLFGPSIPIVIEGRFVGPVFHSDRVLIKHDETYDEVHSGRVKEAKRDAEKNSSSTVPAP